MSELVDKFHNIIDKYELRGKYRGFQDLNCIDFV